MIRSAVTIALVPEITKGPWVFWNDLEAGIKKAAGLGFDAVELFTGSGNALPAEAVQQLATRYNVGICAVGTGAGKVVRGLTLSDPDPAVRAKAVAFIEEMIVFGAAFGAPAIIGSMQGNVLPGANRAEVLKWLAEGLHAVAEKAAPYQLPVIYEPLNRYETNLFNLLDDAVDFLQKENIENVALLADLFHMNIEEDSIADTINRCGNYIGHVHFADSNRKAIGLGHTAMKDVAAAFTDIGYSKFISAEIFPLPDADTAARQTIQAFRTWFPKQ